jgi:hypothetical protein
MGLGFGISRAPPHIFILHLALVMGLFFGSFLFFLRSFQQGNVIS